MGREAEVVAFGAVQPGSGQGHELTDPAGQAGQVPATADVRKQADARLA